MTVVIENQARPASDRTFGHASLMKTFAGKAPKRGSLRSFFKLHIYIRHKKYSFPTDPNLWLGP